MEFRQGIHEVNHENEPSEGVAVLQAWLSSQGMEIILGVDIWKDPATWGVLLADLVRHVSDAYEKAHQLPYEKTKSEVLRIFRMEIENPTDAAQGHIHRAH